MLQTPLSRAFDAKGLSCQLREYETTPALGEPDTVKRELVHADFEPTEDVEAHIGNDEIRPLFVDRFSPFGEEEECSVAVRPELVTVFSAESLDLALRKAELIEVHAESIVDLRESAVFCHLMNLDGSHFGGWAGNIEIPVVKIGIPIAGKNIFGLPEGLGAVHGIERDPLLAVETAKVNVYPPCRFDNGIKGDFPLPPDEEKEVSPSAEAVDTCLGLSRCYIRILSHFVSFLRLQAENLPLPEVVGAWQLRVATAFKAQVYMH